jgi:hypothetical protein
MGTIPRRISPHCLAGTPTRTLQAFPFLADRQALAGRTYQAVVGHSQRIMGGEK